MSYRGGKLHNEYAASLEDAFDKCPKAVCAAIAASALTCGGDYIGEARHRFIDEWWALYDAGIVPQKPPFHKGRAE